MNSECKFVEKFVKIKVKMLLNIEISLLVFLKENKFLRGKRRDWRLLEETKQKDCK